MLFIMPRSHKRKRPPRVQAEILDEQVEVVSAPEDDGEPELDTEEPQRQDEIGDANHRVKVEAEIWDTFREEFHEGAYPLSPRYKGATNRIDSGGTAPFVPAPVVLVITRTRRTGHR
jgi:hypothetical protein